MKRLLSCILALTLVICMVPETVGVAFADDIVQAEAAANETVQQTSDDVQDNAGSTDVTADGETPQDEAAVTETETGAVTEETETIVETPDSYDIAANLKLKEKDDVKTLKTDHFILTLTHGDSWDVKVNSKTSITIYNTALYEANRGGKLVTILAFDTDDDSYDVLPDYSVIGKSGGKVYVAAYPTDMQYDSSNKKAVSDYMAVFDEASRLKEGTENSPLAFNN